MNFQFVISEKALSLRCEGYVKSPTYKKVCVVGR